MSKPIITILVGPPGSGKSNYCKVAMNHGFIRINQDEQGKQGHLDLFKSSLEDGKNIVVDRMNFSKDQRERYLSPARELGYECSIIVFHVPMVNCLNNCLSRKDHPTIKTEEDAKRAIKFFFRKYERVENGEADNIIRHGWDNHNPIAVVCDLDGTLCNVDHRRHFVRDGERDWKGFFDSMVDDSPNLWCVELIRAMHELYPIVFATGRPSDYTDHTIEWLSKHDIIYDDLFMRLEGDYRRDDIIKEIILEFEILPRYGILFVVDDRKQVVDMWRKNNITVLQCDEGNF